MSLEAQCQGINSLDKVLARVWSALKVFWKYHECSNFQKKRFEDVKRFRLILQKTILIAIQNERNEEGNAKAAEK